MDKKILSDEEISALLSGMKDNNLNETLYTEILYEKFNYENLKKYKHSLLPGLDIIGERFKGIFIYTLAEVFNLKIDIKNILLIKKKFKDCFNEDSENAENNYLYTFNSNCLKGECYLGLDNKFLFYLIDICLLGKGRVYQKENSFTVTEFKAINRIIKIILNVLEKAWKTIFDINFSYLSCKIKTVVKALKTTEKEFYTLSFALNFDGINTNLNLYFPVLFLEPINKLLLLDIYSYDFDAPDNQERLKKHLMDINLNLSVELNDFKISAKNLMFLSKGKNLMLNKDVKDYMVLKANGIEKFKVLAGTFRGRNAVKISG